MSDTKIPDYTGYSLSELRATLQRLDRQRFPERAEALEAEISRRVPNGAELIREDANRPFPKVFAVMLLVMIAASGLLIIASWVIPDNRAYQENFCLKMENKDAPMCTLRRDIQLQFNCTVEMKSSITTTLKKSEGTTTRQRLFKAEVILDRDDRSCRVDDRTLAQWVASRITLDTEVFDEAEVQITRASTSGFSFETWKSFPVTFSKP